MYFFGAAVNAFTDMFAQLLMTQQPHRSVMLYNSWQQRNKRDDVVMLPFYIFFRCFLRLKKTKQKGKCFAFQFSVGGTSCSTLNAIVVLWMILCSTATLAQKITFIQHLICVWGCCRGSRGIMCRQSTLLVTKQRQGDKGLLHFLLLKYIHPKEIHKCRTMFSYDFIMLIVYTKRTLQVCQVLCPVRSKPLLYLQINSFLH